MLEKENFEDTQNLKRHLASSLENGLKKKQILNYSTFHHL
jgi:hypothetical protein